MEQKRTLLIVAAVGIFLLVVLGAALILNSATSTAAKTDIENPAIQVTNDWLLPEGEIKTISSGEDLSNGSVGSSQDTSAAQPSDIIAADSPATLLLFLQQQHSPRQALRTETQHLQHSRRPSLQALRRQRQSKSHRTAIQHSSRALSQ